MSVYLIGAGPGDVELLTLKAVAILKIADVVLYDALVNQECFNFCKEDVIKINVGKRKKQHLKEQAEINSLLLKYSLKYKIVVRLKGGTPFVFGRGYEEVDFLQKNKITPIIISGVSSTTAVPESFMIPLIDRKFNDSYRTITGHDMDVFNNIITSYNKRENLIILMGIHNLKKITVSLLDKNFPQKTLIAILSKGTTNQSQKIISTLEEISKKEESFFQQIKSLTPAIIFVGETIRNLDPKSSSG